MNGRRSNLRIARTKRRLRQGYVAAGTTLLIWISPAAAEIVRTTASVSATSQELMDGEPASVTSNVDELLPDASNLPLAASAELTSTNLVGELIAMGLAFSDFDDPTRLDQPNPEEFAIEAACFSDDAGVSYFVESIATESRTVRFSEGEIDFSSGTSQEVQSSIFLTGAVVVWTRDAVSDLSEMNGLVAVTVTRDGGETLFETSVTITGTAAGDIETDTSGAINANSATVADLVALGLDVPSRDVLESVEDSGTLIVLIIPAQEHTYTYAVERDREYELLATLSATLSNAPGGTGIAAVLGRPFANVAGFVEVGLAGANGDLVESAINKAIAQQDNPDNPDADPNLATQPGGDSPGSSARPSLCGALGLETIALFSSALFLACCRVGRRRRA